MNNSNLFFPPERIFYCGHNGTQALSLMMWGGARVSGLGFKCKEGTEHIP